jgi:hypothetical protein
MLSKRVVEFIWNPELSCDSTNKMWSCIENCIYHLNTWYIMSININFQETYFEVMKPAAVQMWLKKKYSKTLHFKVR